MDLLKTEFHIFEQMCIGRIEDSPCYENCFVVVAFLNVGDRQLYDLKQIIYISLSLD